MRRPSSPSPSASGSIGFTFEAASSTNSIAKPRANFWDFEAYSRSFLHEKKSIEREKEEWERKVEERSAILNKSIDFYAEKYKKLTEESAACLIKSDTIFNSGNSLIEAENEIKRAEQEVDKVKSLLKYFKELEKVLIIGRNEEEFKADLMRKDWKSALNKLAASISDDDEDDVENTATASPTTSSTKITNLLRFKRENFDYRIRFYYETIEKRIKTHVDGLGWPKIVSNDETVEIISRLQEILTYGEAIYILSKKSIIVEHPIKYFIDPIRIRFDYHFNSDRPTNQLDKPEWYFDHLIGICRESLSFLREFILPCWRLRDLDDFLKDGIISIAVDKTGRNLEILKGKEEEDHDNSLVYKYFMEMGKFLDIIKEEFGFIEIEGIIEQVFIKETMETFSFVESELERVKSGYSKLFPDGDDCVDEWTCTKNTQMGEPCAPVLKFLSFFHSSTILPYNYIKKDMKLRSLLLFKVQSWLLEQFHDKCLFDCSPLHNSRENILKDIGMINSLSLICKVLEDDFGESMVSNEDSYKLLREYLELSSTAELHELIGYDPSSLPGTCFNRAIEAFKTISDKLSSHLFNYVIERYFKYASPHANSMIYANCEEGSGAISENLRLAVGNLIEALNFIKPFLCEQKFKKLFNQTLPEKLAAFMFQGVLLKNFFNEQGADRFYQDLQYIQEALNQVINPENLKSSFVKVFEAVEILKIKEKDPTGPFDGVRLSRAVKENRVEELKRFLELLRLNHLRVDELSQIFASRRH